MNQVGISPRGGKAKVGDRDGRKGIGAKFPKFCPVLWLLADVDLCVFCRLFLRKVVVFVR